MKEFEMYCVFVPLSPTTPSGESDDNKPANPNDGESPIYSDTGDSAVSLMKTSDDYSLDLFCKLEDRFYFGNSAYNQRYRPKIVYLGPETDLSLITVVPLEGWTTETPAKEGSYAVSYIARGRQYFLRLIISFNHDITGVRIGFNVKYQYFVPANYKN
ncbi:MAG: hypothetical protein ACI35T_02595 [Alistipes sp.]